MQIPAFSRDRPLAGPDRVDVGCSTAHATPDEAAFGVVLGSRRPGPVRVDRAAVAAHFKVRRLGGFMFPDDDDGDALRRVASNGADMSRPMSIDFFVAVPDREAGEAIVRVAMSSGYRAELVHDAEDDAWDCYCSKVMLPTYDGVVQTQREVDELGRPFGGQCDGLGTPGNSAA